MSKQSLYKLFYADNNEHKKEYERRSTSDDTIKFNINIGEYQAFFCQTVYIYKLMVSIERTDKEICYLYGLLPPKAIRQFENRCLIDEIVLTNNIEGVHSTRKEIDAILNDLSQHNEKQRFWGLVKKYLLLINGEHIPMNTCQDIRNIYNDIFLDEIKTSNPENIPDGKIFRKSSVSVYSATQKEIHKGLYPESKIIEIMEKSLDILNNDSIDTLIRTAIFHYLFGFIHPFYDGNGRTSRFISSYMLSHELNHLIGYRISYTIKENINKYYEAFKVCNHPNNRGDLTPFVEMFLEIVDMSEKQLSLALRKRVDALEYYENALSEMFTNDKVIFELYYVLVQATLFSNWGISFKELEEHLKVSYNTINKYMKNIPQNILIKQKQNRLMYCSFDLTELDKYIEAETN
ncbi:MAG: Fic family protein [Oscillospiraceae bacterium]|nr:Fic family protein [Oscillospiraceae bacterium]